jgi:ketosteroid isomerase-like protein
MQPVQAPITGSEAASPETPLGALAEFYRAFNRGDLELMQANWASGEDVAMDNPLGGIKRGWREIRSVYETLFQGAAEVHVEFWDYTLHQGADFFYAVGRERGEWRLGDERLPLAIRSTRLFRRSDKRWRQVHHHGSIDDPALLQRYQELVRGTAAG